MREVQRWLLTVVAFTCILAQPECWSEKYHGQDAPRVQGEIPSIATAKSVNFKFDRTKRDLNSALRNFHPEPSIMALPGGTPTVTFKLILVNVGNSSNPTTTLSKTVSVVNGQASTSFESIPAQTVIGDVSIVGGKMGGYADFHGSLDLQAGVINI